jgi:hypothetical protein
MTAAASLHWGNGGTPPRPAPNYHHIANEPLMLARLLCRVTCTGRAALQALRRRLLTATKPAAPTLVAGALADLLRSKPELVAENALLRQQLAVLTRSVKRPRCTPADRALLVLLASRVRGWHQALLIVQPDTLLRWHRQLFRRFWRWKSRTASAVRRPKVSAETIALIREMAAANCVCQANCLPPRSANS